MSEVVQRIPESELLLFQKEMQDWPQEELARRFRMAAEIGSQLIGNILYGIPPHPESELRAARTSGPQSQPGRIVDQWGHEIHPDYKSLAWHGIALLPGRGRYRHDGDNDTVDAIACRADVGPRQIIRDIKVLLIRRRDAPDKVAAPGGYIDDADRLPETLSAQQAAYAAALRELKEETGLAITATDHLYPPYIFERVRRASLGMGWRGWPTSQAIGLYPTRECWEDTTFHAGDDAIAVSEHSYYQLMNESQENIWWRRFHAESTVAAVKQLLINIALDPRLSKTTFYTDAMQLGAIALSPQLREQGDPNPEA